jgi:hypothetical protein
MSDVIVSQDIDNFMQAANKAAARTNLGVGANDDVTFNTLYIPGSAVVSGVVQAGLIQIYGQAQFLTAQIGLNATQLYGSANSSVEVTLPTESGTLVTTDQLALKAPILNPVLSGTTITNNLSTQTLTATNINVRSLSAQTLTVDGEVIALSSVYTPAVLTNFLSLYGQADILSIRLGLNVTELYGSANSNVVVTLPTESGTLATTEQLALKAPILNPVLSGTTITNNLSTQTLTATNINVKSLSAQTLTATNINVKSLSAQTLTATNINVGRDLEWNGYNRFSPKISANAYNLQDGQIYIDGPTLFDTTTLSELTDVTYTIFVNGNTYSIGVSSKGLTAFDANINRLVASSVDTNNLTTTNANVSVITAANANINTLTAREVISDVNVTNITTTKTFSYSADNSKIFNFNTASGSISAIFPGILPNGFNVGITNIGTNTVYISSTQVNNLCATSNKNSTQFSGIYIYKTNNALYGIGKFN